MSSGSRLAIFAIVAVGLTVSFIFLPVRDLLLGVIEWVKQRDQMGIVIYGAIYIVATVAFIPGTILTLGAGLLFGVIVGSFLISIASTIGAAIAFIVGRTLAREYVEARSAQSPKFKAIDEAVGKEGFKIVLLTRLSPLFPFNLLNYLFGITKVSFWKYVLASWIGMFPGTVMYIYFGATVKNLVELSSDKVQGGYGKMVLFGIGLVATIVVTIYVTHLARKAIKSHTELEMKGDIRNVRA